MYQFTPGSQLWQLITMLSFVGEYPHRSRQLLGNKDAYKMLINKLTRPQSFLNTQTGATMTCRLLSVSGKGHDKTIRLYKAALPILEWIEPETKRYYLDAFRNHRFSGDKSHRERNHRIAEVAAMCMRTGIEARPYRLPELQNEDFLYVIPSEAVMYPAKDLKRLSEDEMSKTSFTRMVGALFAGNECYAMYNTRDAAMRWSGKGEFKARDSLQELANMNSGISRVDSAVLAGQSGTVALNTIMESDKSEKHEFRFDSMLGYVPTESMEPTLETGSLILGLRLFDDLENGDIIIFRHDGSYLVKRIAACAGDTLVHQNTIVTVSENCYYVLGDNAEHSHDSRYWENPFVSHEDVIAKLLIPIR